MYKRLAPGMIEKIQVLVEEVWYVRLVADTIISCNVINKYDKPRVKGRRPSITL
jgi:hypothetical protein